jgi:hypothetical protein
MFAALTSKAVHASLDNVLMLPSSWFIILLVICGERIVRFAREHRQPGIELTVAAAYLAQFVVLAYAPSKVLPTPERADVNGNRVATVSGNPDNTRAVRVWLQTSALAPAGYADGLAVGDLLRGASAEATVSFVNAARASLCSATPAHPVLIDAGLLSEYGGIRLASGPICEASSRN